MSGSFPPTCLHFSCFLVQFFLPPKKVLQGGTCPWHIFGQPYSLSPFDFSGILHVTQQKFNFESQGPKGCHVSFARLVSGWNMSKNQCCPTAEMLKEQKTPRCDEGNSLPGSFEKNKQRMEKNTKKKRNTQHMEQVEFFRWCFQRCLAFFFGLRCHFVYAFWSFVCLETLGI